MENWYTWLTTVDKAIESRQYVDIILDNDPENFSVAFESKTVYSIEEKNKYFEDRKFFKQCEIHPDAKNRNMIFPYKEEK